MTEPQIVSEVTGFSVKSMRGPSRWLRRFCLVLFVVAFIVTAWTESCIPFVIAVVIGLIVTVSIVCYIRCPQCRSRLSPREFHETQDRRRLYYDCSACQITWRSELVNEDD